MPATNNNNNPNAKTVTVSLESSNLREAAYDPFMKTMVLRFHTGGDYEYINVDREVFDELTKAKSAGRFFHTKIKGKFDFLKVTKRPVVDDFKKNEDDNGDAAEIEEKE